MRKRTIKCAADTIFWYLIYLLPVLAYLIYLFAYLQNPGVTLDEVNTPANVLKFSTFLVRTDIQPLLSQGPFYTTLAQIFGSTGVLPLFSTGSVLHLLATYYVSAFLVHLIVDFLLFIPKLAMKWMNHFTNTED